MNRQSHAPACRLYVLVAADAPVALVLRRGPTDWWHLLQWDLVRLTVSPGAWFHGTLYPRRCDISRDGRLFGYFARKATGGKAGWPESYFAVSKSPWLEALASWETCGAWTWGCSFSASGALCITGCVGDKPFHGDYPEPVSICAMNTDWRGRDLWNEVKRGWRTAGGSTTGAALADRPGLVMLRDRPGEGGTVTLGLIHNGVDFARGGMEGVRLEYFLQHERDGVTPLPRTVWADWDRQGRLLSATSDGAVEILEWRNGKLERIWWEDLRAHSPNPEAAPEWAGRW